MKAFLPFLPCVLLGLLSIGCATVTVQTDYDKAASFGVYRTYSLQMAPQGVTMAPSGQAALRDTLRDQLAARGIIEAAQGQPADLEVVTHLVTSLEVDVQQYTTTWRYGYRGTWPYRGGAYGMWVGAPVGYVDVNTYTSGTLILDFVDTKTKMLVFRGTGTGSVGTAKANAKKVASAVTKIVRRLPLTPGHP
ncbi:MAG: DUF4136 domain-containing protein [Verrucomicrobiales bacterium]|nr:DUF4136 domain-containing protein [Verrucomicrobiales bacterium]